MLHGAFCCLEIRNYFCGADILWLFQNIFWCCVYGTADQSTLFRIACFLICLWHSPSCLAHERERGEGAGEEGEEGEEEEEGEGEEGREREIFWDVATLPMCGRKSQFPIKSRLYRVSHEQRHGVTFEGHHGIIAFLSVCTRIYFHTHHCVCSVCIKVWVIFPSNSPSGLIILTWDDLFRLGY